MHQEEENTGYFHIEERKGIVASGRRTKPLKTFRNFIGLHNICCLLRGEEAFVKADILEKEKKSRVLQNSKSTPTHASENQVKCNGI